MLREGDLLQYFLSWAWTEFSSENPFSPGLLPWGACLPRYTTGLYTFHTEMEENPSSLSGQAAWRSLFLDLPVNALDYGINKEVSQIGIRGHVCLHDGAARSTPLHGNTGPFQGQKEVWIYNPEWKTLIPRAPSSDVRPALSKCLENIPASICCLLLFSNKRIHHCSNPDCYKHNSGLHIAPPITMFTF